MTQQQQQRAPVSPGVAEAAAGAGSCLGSPHQLHNNNNNNNNLGEQTPVASNTTTTRGISSKSSKNNRDDDDEDHGGNNNNGNGAKSPPLRMLSLQQQLPAAPSLFSSGPLQAPPRAGVDGPPPPPPKDGAVAATAAADWLLGHIPGTATATTATEDTLAQTKAAAAAASSGGGSGIFGWFSTTTTSSSAAASAEPAATKKDEESAAADAAPVEAVVPPPVAQTNEPRSVTVVEDVATPPVPPPPVAERGQDDKEALSPATNGRDAKPEANGKERNEDAGSSKEDEKSKPVNDAPKEENVETEEEDEEEGAKPPRELTEEERQQLDEAFASAPQTSTTATTPTKNAPALAAAAGKNSAASGAVKEDPRVVPAAVAGRLTVSAATPIPNAAVCLRLLRKFAAKTRPQILRQYGGSQSRSILSYVLFLSSSDQQESTFSAYRTLLDCIFEPGEDRNAAAASSSVHEDEDLPERLAPTGVAAAAVVPVHVTADPAVQARAAAAVAAFVDLFAVWGHASSALTEKKDKKAQAAFGVLQVAILDAACNLAAHGCLNNVQIAIAAGGGGGGTAAATEYHVAAQMLASSVFNSDLSLERVELAAMKFLLGAGCRQDPSLLRGSYLLQSIRTLYHVYLTTESKSNKVTARAALQQLVTSVFAKVVQTPVVEEDEEGNRPIDIFPTENHRDAFLVLRSICKLSMRNLPEETGMHSHVGLQTSASNDTWDGERLHSASERAGGGGGGRASVAAEPAPHGRQQQQQQQHHHHAHLIYTGAIHPALESKLLALELILYVLQNTDFTGFIQHCGPQFHAAIRNYLCVSLLKNCTSDNTRVVSLSLRIFVPVVRNFRTVLKTEIEAFVTNVFFVILDSKNSPAEHKSIVVNTFNEICSDPSTLAEIFLNYDCDLSAVDLFHRIVNTLSRLARSGLQEPQMMRSSGMSSLMMGGGPSEAQMEKFRSESRELRLDAMRALRQILASLHASIVEPMGQQQQLQQDRLLSEGEETEQPEESGEASSSPDKKAPSSPASQQLSPTSPDKQQTLVEIYGSKKKRRAEESEAVLRFNQKPSAGIAYAAKCKHIDPEDPADVARYLLKNKDELDKAMIGEYLGREVEYQNGFSFRVLHEYVRLMDFTGLVFDDAIRFFLSGFRLPGEAQKIDRIMEKFAERFTEQNPTIFPTADAAFILSFSIIMLNTDLHNPAIKEERRMTKEGFVRNNRGICDGQDLPEELLTSIFDRIKQNPISLKEDEEARERIGDTKKTSVGRLPAALNPASFFSSHYNDMDRARETNFQKERDHIVRTTESLLKRRRHGAEMKSPSKSRSFKSHRAVSRFVLSGDSGLRDEYVSPMFEVTWGPALAAFSTAMESANGTMGALISIASDEELELAAENAAQTIEVCLTGFRFAIGTAGLCGNSIARDAYMLALSRFSQLGTGVLLEPRHIRCVQTMFSLAREDGELLGGAWEHVFKALSEVNRFHQVFHLMARNDRVAALAAERRRRRLEAMEKKKQARELRKASAEDGEFVGDANEYGQSESDDDDDSLAESGLFTDDDDFGYDDNMDAKAIDEANAREVYDAVSEATIEAIYERSSSLSAHAVKEFVVQLCLVSRAEISVGTNDRMGDLNQVTYRQKHALLNSNSNAHAAGDQFHHTQPNIYNLQKLVEVTHYNMASRPRLLFAEIWVTVADHLTNTALHSNPAIAMYAVDSFRQLSIQYLQRDELEVFEFQRRFLKPLETVMALSKQTSTKELLLNCVGRLMHVFGTNSSSNDSASRRQGGLRSGWVPILTILGIGGRDTDEGIAQMSFKTLSGEIKLCLHDNKHPDVLLTEHFVETVNSLLNIIGGPHDDISVLAIDQLVVLTDALADGTIPPLPVKRKASPNSAPELPKEEVPKRQLELWWPVLLGLSRTVGDPRNDVRSKSLDALFGIINKHFFPTDPAEETSSTLETVQLIFRGVLNSVLEFAETSSDDEPIPGLPDDFERIVNDPKDERKNQESNEELNSSSWLETTFEAFMDACVGICLRSMANSKDSVLVEEVFAMLNSCLLSDSGALAVRGLRRLEQFVTSDLDTASLSDDIWATVSHMLQRCLTVRGLPKKDTKAEAEVSSEEEAKYKDTEYFQAVNEFIAEDRFLSYRRYVGSNATMVIGLLLCNDRFSIGLRWRLFLVKWLHRGIREWDSAAAILSAHDTKRQTLSSRLPDYRETALYGRKWINRLVLQLAAMNEIVLAPPNGDPKTNRFVQGQKQVIELTEGMLMSFVQKEEAASAYRHTALDELIYKRYTGLVRELLAGYGNMADEDLKRMSWISPVLLGSCIRSKNEDIRLMVQKLVSRTSPAPTPVAPYPPPPPAKSLDPRVDGQNQAKSPDPPAADGRPDAP